MWGGYVASIALIPFGILMGFITYIASGLSHAGMAVALPFVVVPGAMLVYLYLTQETLTKNPMPWKRAVVFASAALLILFGIMSGGMLWLMNGSFAELGAKAGDFKLSALFLFMVFTIPGACLYAFMALTGKSREKEWVLRKREQQLNGEFRGE